MVEINLFNTPQPGMQPAEQRRGPDNAGSQRLSDSVNETASRLAVLEERMSNMRKKMQLTEQSLIEHERDVRSDLKALSETVTELSRKVEGVKEQIDAMSGEISSVVRKPEFTVLERYLDLWQPMSFMTREEAKLLIKDALEEKGAKKS